MQVGNGEVRVEVEVLHSVTASKSCEPILYRTQLGQDVVVDVQLEPEDLAFLQDWLPPWVVAPGFTFLVTASIPPYLTGEPPPSDPRRTNPLLR